MVLQSYKLFQFDELRIALSLRPERRVGSDDLWDQAEEALEEVLTSLNLEFEKMSGEGAFYGPKIDFFVPDAIGREWQLGTVQLDFSLPERFDLEYVAEDGVTRRPVMVHRAMLGTIERFLGVMIAHYAGSFHPWLSPTQVVVIPIADRHIEYADKVASSLRNVEIRVEVDDRSERMNLKIRQSQLQKIPYMLVVGDREAESNSAAVRMRDGQDLGSKTVDEVVALIHGKIVTKG